MGFYTTTYLYFGPKYIKTAKEWCEFFDLENVPWCSCDEENLCGKKCSFYYIPKEDQGDEKDCVDYFLWDEFELRLCKQYGNYNEELNEFRIGKRIKTPFKIVDLDGLKEEVEKVQRYFGETQCEFFTGCCMG